MRHWESALRRRLETRSEARVTPGWLTDPRAAALFLGFAYLIGPLLGIAALALPQPRGTDVVGLLVLNLVGLSVGAYLLLRRNRVTQRDIGVALLIGTILVTLAIQFTESRTGVYSLLYVWIALEAAFFLSRRAAFLQLAFIATAFGLVLAGERPAAAEELWVVTVGTLLLVGVLVGVLKSHLERLIASLADAAQTDPLTELCNRRGFQEVLAAELDRARRTNRPVGLLVADLDHFKRVNDLLGHPGGDETLKQFAVQMRRLTRSMDLAARLGGEEFALVLPEAAKHNALLVAERLRRAARAAFASTPAPLTVSIGVACYPDDGATADELLLAGDQALYAAKQLGRDRSVLFNADVASELATSASDSKRPGQLTAVLVLAETIDTRIAGAADHSQAVVRYARAAAAELGLAPTAVERLALAGVLHDVGKTGVSDAVLQKPGPLDEDEWAQMRMHPELGARILAGADLEDIAGWVFAHHERIDGGGYPLGLRGDEIPLEARILAVADAYEAMTSERPYSAAVSPAAAAAELRRCADSQFDPEVVEALLSALQPDRDRLEAAPAELSSTP
ncbi:MAG TPA: diguanylate cyclase [Thermoleophilaceae bacterium]|nr:diguanylate cyclase [Thermoleophilaceae bacterium]